MHNDTGVRDPAEAFPLPRTRDDVSDRRAAIARQLPEAGSLTWTARAAPS